MQKLGATKTNKIKQWEAKTAEAKEAALAAEDALAQEVEAHKRTMVEAQAHVKEQVAAAEAHFEAEKARLVRRLPTAPRRGTWP